MPDFVNRRQAIRGGLVVTAGLLLAACQRQRAGGWKPMSADQIEGPPRRELSGGERPTRVPSDSGFTLGGVIPRREWASAGPNLSLINPMNGVRRITVHHDGMPPVSLRTKADVAHRLELIRSVHTGRSDDNGRNWADIGYHYIVDPQGRVWEGRPVRYQGAHVKQNNENNLGILVLGNFDEQRPTSEAINALDAFLADRMRAYRVPVTRVFTHQEINPTACPGFNLQSYMVATRSGRGYLARA
ncbi:MAG: N-acetylmuramoyl-L-alanine amidase [Phycisphaeraceae bacterium]|nr:N-acetylmuramoyl-L-alanine amidase [Phycisphaeraceae bacterium]